MAHPPGRPVKALTADRFGVTRSHETIIVTGSDPVSENVRELIHAAFTQVGAA